ncbi:MAG: helix-turn-helix domain-containing protein [Lachnospiraceae bacterium]|nr:helix-turn-helix domain-containing protein [Lachnospiraceae bacterium]
MLKIGKKIAELRKKANMTQMELADRLGISYQAVSNWERGNSMPDISKLPELASMFEITIDELLGERVQLVTSAAEGGLDEYMENNEISPEEIRSAAPLLKPVQVKEIFEKKGTNNIEKIAPLLPFLAEDDINRFLEKAGEDGETGAVLQIAPFASEDAIRKVAEKWSREKQSIKALLPFMSEDDVWEFAQQSLAEGAPEAVLDFLPFMAEDEVGKLAIECYEKEGTEAIKPFLPFMAEDEVGKLAIECYEKEGTEAIKPFLPFMAEDEVGRLALEDYKTGGIEKIKPLLPFMTEEDVAKLARMILE